MGRMSGFGASPDDGALVAAFRQGRRRAFEVIVHRHYPVLLRVAERRCGPGALAEDAVQTALIRAHRYLQGGGAIENLGAWLRRVVVNCAADLLRTERRQRSGLEHAVDIAVADVAAARAERSELRRLVAAAIDRLPEVYRETLRLRYLHGVEAREIALRLGDNLHTVKSHIARGRRELRRRLEPVLERGGYL